MKPGVTRCFLAYACMTACTSGQTLAEQTLPVSPDAQVGQAQTPWPAEALPALPEPDDNPMSEAKRVLGRFLFHDPLLSSDRKVACVSCHSEIWGLGDQLARSIGVGGSGPIGPGRTGPNSTRRNAPSLWNAGYKERLFWDGRAASLEQQVLFPLRAMHELNRAPEDVVADLRAIDEYLVLFERAFPETRQPLNVENLARALATFVRHYVSDHSAYDQYIAGDAQALYPQDLRGMALFAQLSCDTCHVPPRFESEQYHARQLPEVEGVQDEGRAEVTGEAADRGAFRTPSLRNLRETGPYFHAGQQMSLQDAVRHEVDLQLQQAQGDDARALAPQQLDDLVAFLRRALVDTSGEQFRPDYVPSGLPIPPDGDQLIRF